MNLIISSIIKNHKYYEEWKRLENRHIMRAIYDEVIRAKEYGKTKVSIKSIMGKLRWEETLKIKGDGEYKINDKYSSIYAHVIADTFKELDPLIERRRIRAIGE